MRLRTVVTTLVLAGVAAAAVQAAGMDASSLVLQKSDVPAGARRVSFGSSKGSIKIPGTVRGQAAYAGWRFKNGAKTETVAAAAAVVGSASDAHKVYAKAKRDVTGRGTFKALSLPRYGDEQFSLGSTLGPYGGGFVFVRSGKRLWEFVVSGYPGFSRSFLAGELRKYAPKERARAT